jgi:two-component system sensor histidine kinase QseC
MAQFTNIDLFDITRNVIEDIINDIDKKHQKLEFDGKKCEVFGDAFAIEIMLKNILRNAIKYTPDSGKLLIRIREREDQHIIQVMDNGLGIPVAEYDRVFERFYRIGGDRHNSTSLGCGLGLSIVQYIAEIHNASLHLESSEFESGLLFTVSFPTKKILTGSA